MRIAHAPSQLHRRPRAVAIGTFDGVHRGHRSVLQTAVQSGLEPTVITLDPHPRIVLGNRVELLTTLVPVTACIKVDLHACCDGICKDATSNVLQRIKKLGVMSQ